MLLNLIAYFPDQGK